MVNIKSMSCHSWSMYPALSTLQTNTMFNSQKSSAGLALSFLPERQGNWESGCEIIGLVSHSWRVPQLRLEPVCVDPKLLSYLPWHLIQAQDRTFQIFMNSLPHSFPSISWVPTMFWVLYLMLGGETKKTQVPCPPGIFILKALFSITWPWSSTALCLPCVWSGTFPKVLQATSRLTCFATFSIWIAWFSCSLSGPCASELDLSLFL